MYICLQVVARVIRIFAQDSSQICSDLDFQEKGIARNDFEPFQRTPEVSLQILILASRARLPKLVTTNTSFSYLEHIFDLWQDIWWRTSISCHPVQFTCEAYLFIYIYIYIYVYIYARMFVCIRLHMYIYTHTVYLYSCAVCVGV